MAIVPYGNVYKHIVRRGLAPAAKSAGHLLGIIRLIRASRHFVARQFYDYSLLGFSLRCATHRNSNIHNPKIGSSCFAEAKHFGAQNAVRHHSPDSSLTSFFGQRFIIFRFLVSALSAYGSCSKQNLQNSKPTARAG